MSDLPPKMPEGEELVRAIELLNSRIEGDLEKESRDELKALIGIYPSQAQAMAWKQALKRKHPPTSEDNPT